MRYASPCQYVNLFNDDDDDVSSLRLPNGSISLGSLLCTMIPSSDAAPTAPDDEHPHPPNVKQIASRTTSSISWTAPSSWWQPLADDLTQMQQGHVPVHIQVSLRVAVCAFLSYIFALVDLPHAIPPSQRYTIGMVGPMLGLLFPTLLFSILALIIPAMPVIVLLALVVSTALLLCATVSLRLYVALFALTAVLFSSMRFAKATGPMTAIFLMNISLNTQGFALTAREQGTDFVKSLWTETGPDNPNAVFTNSLLGFLWICVAAMAGRLVPPWETVRSMLSRGTVPDALRNVAALIELKQQMLLYHNNTTTMNHRQQSDKGDPLPEQAPFQESSRTSNVREEEHVDFHSLQQEHDALQKKLLHTKATLTDGSLATLTAFEPRLLHFLQSPPECSWKVLKELMVTVDRIALAALCVNDIWLLPRASRDDNHHDATGNTTTIMTDPNGMLSRHEKASRQLLENAKALETMQMVDSQGDSNNSAQTNLNMEEGNIPAFLDHLNEQLAAATNDWIRTMTTTDRHKSFLDEEARTALKDNLLPILEGSGYGFVKATIKSLLHFLKISSWKSVLLPPFAGVETFAWCLKFGIGLGGLVTMYLYWPNYRNLEVPTNDSGETAHFAGWILISYAMATSQTAEGTVKKGLLRLIGTVAGGLNGWLAVTACGADNVPGLVAWLTISTIVVSYIGLPRGPLARMGASPDYGYGPTVVLLTQGLVVVDVFIGAGGKADITVNRIVGNCVGIGMAIIMANVPPSIYGGNPKYAKAIWQEETAILVKCLERLLEFCDERERLQTSSFRKANRDCAASSSTSADPVRISVCKDLNLIRSLSPIKPMIQEADDFLKDASQLSAFPFWSVDTRLGPILESLKIAGSGIDTSIGFACYVLLHEKYPLLGEHFLADEEGQKALRGLLVDIKKMTFDEDSSGYLLSPDKNASVAASFVIGLNQGRGVAAAMSLESQIFITILRKTVDAMLLDCKQIPKVKWGMIGRNF